MWSSLLKALRETGHDEAVSKIMDTDISNVDITGEFIGQVGAQPGTALTSCKTGTAATCHDDGDD